MNGQIMCLKLNVTWLDSLNYLAMSHRILPEAFGLMPEKTWYHHLFNTTENINYARPVSVSFYDVDHMRKSERMEFLSWYETSARNEIFDNKRVMER
jgi:hypothetical protein